MTSKRATLGVRQRDAALESGDTSPQSKWRPYPKYKDSGVEWLGAIPEHWEITRLKRKASIKYGLGEPPQQHADGLPFIRATNVMRGRIVDHEMQFVDPKDVPWNRDPILRTDDVVVVRSGAYTGDSAIIPAKYDGAIAGYDMVVRPAYCQARFLAWTLLSQYVLQAQIELESMRAAQPHLNAEELGSVLILDLPESEQRAIAAFLDHETAKIDTLIEKKERLIELLQEKRTALITQAVTKGLDPSVPMKDSDVEWLGEIPAHWEVKRLKLASSINMGQSPSSDIVNTSGEGLPFLQGNADFGKEHPTAHTFCPAPPKIAEFGDVLLSVRAPVGALNLADQKYGIGRGLCAIRPNIQILERTFCHYVLQIARHQMDELAKGSTYDAVSSSEVSCLLFSLPSIKEQRTLASFLVRETAKIDALMAKIQEAIDRLKEYHTALISAAVTGEIDVRDA